MTKSESTTMWLLGKIKKRIPALIFLTLCSVGTSLFGVVFSLGTKRVIDSAVGGDREVFLRACALQALIIVAILLCSILARFLREKIHVELDRDWKKTMIHSLLNGEYKSVSAFHSGELINRLNNDVRIVDDGLVNIVPKIASMIVKLVFAFLVLSSLTQWFALALLGAGLIVILVTCLVRRRLKNLHKRVSEATGRVSSIMQEAMEKLLAVQAMDISAEIERRVDARLSERFQLQRKRYRISVFSNTCISVMFYVAGFITLVFCSNGLLTGTMTFGTMTAVTQLVNQIQNPFVGLSGIIPQYISTSASVERLYELDCLPKSLTPLEEPAENIYRRMEHITAQDLVFTYDRDKILDNAEFSLSKGSFCVISGPSGIGKSTLLKLLLGIYTPDKGSLYFQCGDEQITIDGSTRHLFSYVPQGNLLFSGTIKENLLVIKPDATDEEINHAVYISGMDLYLPQLPNGLDTQLGESGAGLSEGQVQRLAIARAILSGAPVLLLDECTSALDANTEALVLQRLRNQSNKTCVAVTHRPIADEICDTVIRMDAGKVRVCALNEC